MDHRVSKDMISSGMTPSGKKTQADLGKTQYGSAPSPNRLMDAYHSMYQNQKEETVDEGMVGDAVKKVKDMGTKVVKDVKFQASNMTDKAGKDQRRAIARKALEDANTKNLNASVDLLSVYQSIYADTFEEGKIPAGLQAYLDKKKGKKKDDDGDEKESKKKDKKDVKEGAGLYANIHAKRKRGGKMRKKGAKGAPSSQDFANAAKTAKEDFEKYDLVYDHFISEGFSEEETYERMSNLTEEQLDEFMKALATRAARYGASLGGNTPAPKLGPARPNAKPGQIGFKAKNPSEVVSDVNIRKREADKFNLQKKKEKLASDPKTAIVLNVNKKEKRGEVMQDSYDYILNHFVNEGYDEKDVIQAMSSLTEEPVSLALIGAKLLGGAKAAATAIKGSKFAATAGKALGKVKNIAKNPVVQSYALNTAMGSGGRGPEERSGKRTSAPVAQYSSTDLFDIVKGQLLDEGLSEEEIKDIMLELTPEEILNEISVSKMSKYLSDADDDVQKTADSIRKDGSVMGDDPRVKRLDKRATGMARAGQKIADKLKPKNTFLNMGEK